MRPGAAEADVPGAGRGRTRRQGGGWGVSGEDDRLQTRMGRAGGLLRKPGPAAGLRRGSRAERSPLPAPADIRGHHCPTHGDSPPAPPASNPPTGAGERGACPASPSLRGQAGRAGAWGGGRPSGSGRPPAPLPDPRQVRRRTPPENGGQKREEGRARPEHGPAVPAAAFRQLGQHGSGQERVARAGNGARLGPLGLGFV